MHKRQIVIGGTSLEIDFYLATESSTLNAVQIAGNGGSSLRQLINSSDQQFFGFCLVNIYQRGKILIKTTEGKSLLQVAWNQATIYLSC